VLLVPTFIAGSTARTSGHIPELAWGFGYWWSWGWIIFTTSPACVLPLARLDRRGADHGRPHLPPLNRLDRGTLAGRPTATLVATIASSPYFICPNCKERSIDHDRREGLSQDAVACHHCGFGFLFELLEDYYPAPATGFVVCDQQGRVLAPGATSSSSPAIASRS
jgi:predicted RNA-binding Zn-ribbon protein involved in translation (DUF1610 family)